MLRPAAARPRHLQPRHTRGWWSASARCTARGTRSSRAPRAPPSDPETGTVDERHPAHRGRAAAGHRAMGFDVVYLTPVHPIGRGQPQGPQQHPRRRRRTTPARPYAIGSPDGGHDAIHPDLGDFDDFDASSPRRSGSAWRWRSTSPCSAAPDHPWVDDPPRVVHHPRRRHDRLRREPAEEVPGHLPAQLRQRPRRRPTPRCAGSSRCGSTTASRSSASTTRTPSRWSSGSG